MLIKSHTKAFHKVLYAEILCTPRVLNFGHVYIATVSIGVQRSDTSSQTGDPSNR